MLLPLVNGSPRATAAGTLLAGGWQFVRGPLGGAAEVWAAAPREDIRWENVTVPHCFNGRDAVDPDPARHFYQGPGWYRRLLDVSAAKPGERTLLHFEGAGQMTDVYLHNVKVAAHVGGYDEWTVDLTDAIEAYHNHPPVRAERFQGRLPLAICCDNSPNLEMIPSQRSDFCLYGGLYRKVSLEQVPAVSIERLHVDAKPDGDQGAQIALAARFYHPTAHTGNVSVDYQITGAGLPPCHGVATLALADGELRVAEIRLPQMEHWSPDHPVLYRVDATLHAPDQEDSSVTETFGVRDFEFVEHGPFKLNGEWLLLRGTHRHEDAPEVGAALTDEMTRREFALIKAMGVNFIRLAHYQQSRLVLQLCDELGILVWEEIPWCRGGLGGVAYQQQARDMLGAMIDQHRNHPAVILWGLGNENDDLGDFETPDQQGAVRTFMQELNAQAHRLDPTRLTTIRRCGFCKDIPDVYSPSIWAGWYRGKFTDYKTVVETERRGVRRFLHAEWGGDSLAGRHAENPYAGLAGVLGGPADERAGDYLMQGGDPRVSRDGDWSESYICDLFDWHLKEQETMPDLTGSAQWIFKDFATPLRPENPVPYVNQKGVVERDLIPKESYYVFQSYWTTAPMAHIYGHTWPVRWGKPDQPRTVKVYSNCPTAELFLNGISQGVRTRDSQDFPAAGLRWEVKFAAGENHLKVVARASSGAEVVDQIDPGYETRAWGAPVRLAVREISRESGAAVVEALALDAQGITCLDSRAAVEFSLAGDGRLVDDQGTAGGSRKVQLANGRATIRVITSHGRSVVGVTAKGIASGLAELIAQP